MIKLLYYNKDTTYKDDGWQEQRCIALNRNALLRMGKIGLDILQQHKVWNALSLESSMKLSHTKTIWDAVSDEKDVLSNYNDTRCRRLRAQQCWFRSHDKAGR